MENLNRPNIKAFVMQNDSMEPTLEEGDTVFADTESTQLVEGKLYVVRSWTTGCVVRRAKLVKGKWKLVADNPVYHTVGDIECDIYGMAVMRLPRGVPL